METQRNKRTVKINATMEEIHKIIKEKEYEEIDKFSLDDTYFIPENLDIEKNKYKRDISKSINNQMDKKRWKNNKTNNIQN